MTSTDERPAPKVSVDHIGRIFALVSRPVQIGDRVEYHEEAVRPPGVRVVAMDRRAGLVYLTREYRRELDEWDWRVPGGKVFDRIDQYLPFYLKHSDHRPSLDKALEPHVLNAAAREAREEAGLTLRDARVVGRSVCGGTVHWDLFFVLADVRTAAENAPEQGERIRVEPVRFNSAYDLLDSGKMNEERSAVWLRRLLGPLTSERQELPDAQ